MTQANEPSDTSESSDQPSNPPAAPSKTTRHIVDSVQTVITALLLAFVFRAFVVEAFIIPTGSMAESLLGRHGSTVCTNCGWEYAFGPARRGSLAGFVPPERVTCPNCQRESELPNGAALERAGDRILVHKWPYVIGGWLGPARWDVIVFRDPADPEQNYIKRVIGLPNETIELIDGDVYVRSAPDAPFRIARKTEAAQEALWFIVFDQDHSGGAHHPVWTPDPEPPDAQAWSGFATRVLHYRAHDRGPRSIVFSPRHSSEYLRDVYGYNHVRPNAYVGDARIVGEVRFADAQSWLECEIDRDGARFYARFASDGTVTLDRAGPADSAAHEQLAATKCAALGAGRPVGIELGHVDYRVYVRVNGRRVIETTDEQYAPDVDALRNSVRSSPLGIRLTGSGGLIELRGVRIDRDVHYVHTFSSRRATNRNPFALLEGEYFVLGDNSPSSHDSREWERFGPHLAPERSGREYRPGTVPRAQIVGRAFFVYLPGLMPIDSRGDWHVPDLGGVRFVR